MNWRRAATWLLPLSVFGAARLISAWFLTVAARVQPDLTDNPAWHVEGTRPESPSYLEILSNWDGQWYKTIALQGYAGIETGDVPEQNALAFSPLYPYTVRLVMAATGWSFEAAASAVSLGCAALAVVLLFRWLSETRGRGPALAAVVALSFFPTAPVLQAAYTEGMAMLLLVIVLRAIVERRTGVVVASGVALAYTRPIMLPVAAFVLYVQWRRSVDEPGARAVDRRAVALAATLGLLAFAWPVTAGVVSGSPFAFWTSQAAWRRDGQSVGGWFVGLWAMGLPLVAAVVAILVAALLALRWRRRGGPVTADLLGGWAGIYALYLLLFAPPLMSIARHLLLTLVPLGAAGPMAEGLGRARRGLLLVGLLVVELALQWLWVRYVFVVENPLRANIP